MTLLLDERSYDIDSAQGDVLTITTSYNQDDRECLAASMKIQLADDRAYQADRYQEWRISRTGYGHCKISYGIVWRLREWPIADYDCLSTEDFETIVKIMSEFEAAMVTSLESKRYQDPEALMDEILSTQN